jgi:putative hemolysin
MAFDIILIFFLILANGIFAMSEIAVVSVRKTRLQQLANEGDDKAEAVLQLIHKPTRFLSTIQIGITLIGIMAGAIGGATLSEKLGELLLPISWLAPYHAAAAFGIVVLVTTYFSLILGELLPKHIAMSNPEKVAEMVVRPMRILSVIAAPAVKLLTWSSESLSRLFGIPIVKEQPVSEEEIKVMIDQGIEHGMFEEAERDMIEGVFDLSDKQVDALMTPRSDIVWIDINETLPEIQRVIRESDHSRFPICDGSLDTVLGIIRAKDILNCIMTEEQFDLRKWMRTPLYIPESAPVLKALENFKKSRQHVALIVDEYGVVQGFVTVYDILEAIVGDIPSFDDNEEPMIVQRTDGSWLLDGLLPMEEFSEVFQIDKIPEGNFLTLGGFIMAQLGRIPATAEHFEWNDLRIEVMDMDGNRVDKVLVVPLSADKKALHPETQPGHDRDAAGSKNVKR